MKRNILFFFLLSLTVSGFAQKVKDTLYFANGSKVIGKIKKAKLGVITFDPDDANDITVKLKKVQTLAALYQLFRIETIYDHVYFGQILPDLRQSRLLILAGRDSFYFYPQEISNLYPFKNSFKERFSGNVGIGYNFTKSSNFGILNVDGNLNYASKKIQLGLSVSGNYSTTDSSFSRDRENIALKNNFYLSPVWFGTVLGQYQRNLELGLLRRYQEGLGVGNKFITSKNVYTWSRLGFVLNQEKNTDYVLSGTLAELFGQLEFNFFRYTKPEVDFVLSEAFYYSLSQKGRVRNDGQIDLNFEIVKDFRLNFVFYCNYDSKPPTEGSNEFDFGIVLGVTLIF
jgi:Protein of unknown function, DUF481